jgi:stage II sporulation protein D
MPGGGYYCDIAPAVEWRRSITAEQMVGGVEAYLRNYVDVSGRVTRVDSVLPGVTSASGRLRSVALVTNRGRYEITGDKIRFVLRPAGGEVLRSTLFRVASTPGDRAQNATAWDIHGRGYGHGVGMCQWGAIGRARAGQDYRRILDVYFPGTTVEPIA